jgi:membrane protease subunit HflK
MLRRNDIDPRRTDRDDEDDDEELGSDRIDADEVMRRARGAASRSQRLAPRLIPVIAVLGLVVWLASGVYVVNPGEQGVVRQFGREIGKTAPGLNYRIPFVQEVDIVNVQAIRRLEVGFRSERGTINRVPAEALMLTGDENIVEAQLIVQYRVRDPSQFLFKMRDPEASLHQVAQVAIRSVVGNTNIEEVLTTGRDAAQDQASQYVQTLMDQYESGIQITEVKLQVVDPPDQVKDAFNEVVRAREDRERQQNEAQAYMEDILPKARGEAQQVIRAADAYRQQRVFQAQGDVAKFAAVLEEYRKGRDVTRERLYLETIERVLASVGKVVVEGSLGEKAVPFLPLNEMNRQPAAPQPQATTAPAAAPTPAAAPPAQGGAGQPQAKPTAPAR